MARTSIRHIVRVSSSPSHSSYLFSQTEERPISTSLPVIHLLKSRKITKTHLYQVHAKLITCDLFHALSRTLLERVSDSGDVEYTLLLFRHINSLKPFCVNNVIKAYSFSSFPHHALAFYYHMLYGGFFPNSYTFIWLFGNCSKLGSLKLSQKFHAQAFKHGVVDCVLPVQNSLIHLYGCCGGMEFGRKVFDGMRERDLVSWNSIISGYVNVGDLGLANQLFDAMPERNVISWNILISGYLKGNYPGCALKIFRRMMRNGWKMNDMTLTSAISACSRSARLKEGCSIHGFAVRRFLNLNIVHETSLIDMYGKCGKVEFARRIFDRMACRNLVCWNAMILGHCIHGNPNDGLKLFADMVDWAGLGNGEGIQPDEVTYIGVLCACARAGLLTVGKKFLSQMVCMYDLKPNFAHYWCMANLYANAGLLQEAEDVLRTMPDDKEDISSESLMLANLLSLCRFRGNATLGEPIAKSLIDKEPWNFAHYRLLLNVYAVAGQWDDVARVKEMIKERKIGRMPGCDLVDLKEIVHDYNVEHHWPEGFGEISMMIGGITGNPS